jgi:DNA-binding transcriptional LysR family regulator
VLREPGSGTLAAVGEALQTHGIALADLPHACHFENNEAVKTQLRTVPGTLGFLSRRALVAELLGEQLEEVPIRGLHLARQLMAAWRTGEALSAVAQQFIHACGVAC